MEGQEQKPQLERVLGFPAILIITINSILGTGIFFLPAVGAKYSGPASIISWMVLSVICIYISMCFAELGSMFPRSGGIYEYTKQAFGRFTSFLLGWGTLVAGNITIAMLVVGAIQYVMPYSPGWMKVASSVFFVLIFNAVAYAGMKTSAMLLVVFGIITMGTLISLIIPGLIKLNPANFSPFFVFPASAVFITIFFIAETFFGWETTTFLGEETKDAERVVPRALFYGTIIIAVLCLLFVVSSLGVVRWDDFGRSATPLTELGFLHFGEIGKKVFTLAVYMSIIGSVAGWIVSAPRLLLALSHDKLFLQQFAYIHPRYKTPSKAILFQTALTITLVLAGFGSYTKLLKLLLPIVLIIYSMVLITLVILRYRKPELTRYFKVPFGKVGPVLVVLFNLSLIGIWVYEESDAWGILKLAASFIFLGVPFYLLLMLYYDPKTIRKAEDITAHFTLLLEKITLRYNVRKEIIELIGNIKGSAVLEYGAGVGTLTIPLSEEVGPKGAVYATHLSEKNMKINKRRYELAKHSSYENKHAPVSHIFDEMHTTRVHPSIKHVDAIISFGSLSCIHDVDKVLREMNMLLPETGKICFVEYTDFFKIIPNIEWMSNDEKIHKVFKSAGFSVRVLRKKGLLWNYVYVYGMKYSKDVPYV